MVRYLMRVVCVLALCASACLAAEEAAPVNLLKNSDLEIANAKGRLANWGMRKLAAVTTEENGFRSGKQGVKMAHEALEYSSVSQWIAVKPNTDYTAVAWIRGENITRAPKGSSAMARLYIGKGGKKRGTLAATPSIKGTFDWRRVTRTFNTRDQDRIGVLVYLHNATGTLWVDDIELYEGKNAPEGTLPEAKKPAAPKPEVNRAE